MVWYNELMSTISETLEADAPPSRSGLILAALSFVPLLLVAAWVLWVAQAPGTPAIDASFLFICHF